eukprot:scaffold31782_cov64-Phaeocystis_antarctica.AAC.1
MAASTSSTQRGEAARTAASARATAARARSTVTKAASASGRLTGCLRSVAQSDSSRRRAGAMSLADWRLASCRAVATSSLYSQSSSPPPPQAGLVQRGRPASTTAPQLVASPPAASRASSRSMARRDDGPSPLCSTGRRPMLLSASAVASSTSSAWARIASLGKIEVDGTGSRRRRASRHGLPEGRELRDTPKLAAMGASILLALVWGNNKQRTTLSATRAAEPNGD